MCARAGRFVLLSALATGIQPAAGHRVWKKGDMDFSLVVPCFNEADNLPTFIAAATSALDKTGMSYELVFVNDGSTDGTAAVLSRELDGCSGTHAAFTVVEFSRNFGKESAMYAGLERATGDCVGFIDADMQQDPAVAIEMFRFLQDHDEYDCVAAVPKKRRESLPLRIFKRMFYHMFNDVSPTHLIENASDFRVFRRCVADALLSMPEHFRFSKGLFAWVGFNTYAMPYDVHERLSGRSKWTVRSLASYAWTGVLAFSTWPLKAVMKVGVLLVLVSLALLGWDMYENFGPGPDVASGQVLSETVLLICGIQMFVMGIFGEYMARAYVETKRRPLYVARRVATYPAGCDVADRNERYLSRTASHGVSGEKAVEPSAEPLRFHKVQAS